MAGSRKSTSSASTSNASNSNASNVNQSASVPSEPKTKRSTKKAEPVVHVSEPEPEQEQTTQPESVVVAPESESKFDTLFRTLQGELKELKDRHSSVTLTLRKLESAHRAEIKSVRKHKQKRNGQHKPTGFAKPQAVPEKLAKFIGVKSGTELTGPQITSAVWKQLKSRNLTYAKDKRVFRTNKDVSALFNVPSSVNDSTDHRDEHGFNFCNLQTYIAHALKGTSA